MNYSNRPILSQEDVNEIDRRFTVAVINNRYIVGDKILASFDELTPNEVHQRAFRLKVGFAVAQMLNGNGMDKNFHWCTEESINAVVDAYWDQGRDWISTASRILRARVMVVPASMVQSLLNPSNNALLGIADGILPDLKPLDLTEAQLSEFLRQAKFGPLYACLEATDWLEAASSRLGEIACGNPEAGFPLVLGYAQSHGVPIGIGDFVLVHHRLDEAGNQVSRITLNAVVANGIIQRGGIPSRI